MNDVVDYDEDDEDSDGLTGCGCPRCGSWMLPCSDQYYCPDCRYTADETEVY